jgi:hypothetical protein
VTFVVALFVRVAMVMVVVIAVSGSCFVLGDSDALSGEVNC